MAKYPLVIHALKYSSRGTHKIIRAGKIAGYSLYLIGPQEKWDCKISWTSFGHPNDNPFGYLSVKMNESILSLLILHNPYFYLNVILFCFFLTDAFEKGLLEKVYVKSKEILAYVDQAVQTCENDYRLSCIQRQINTHHPSYEELKARLSLFFIYQNSPE